MDQSRIITCKENDFPYLQSLTLLRVRIRAAKSAVVKFISKLKSLKELHIQALDDIHSLVLMVICTNGLPELKSLKCTSSDYDTTVIFTWPTPTNIENLTCDYLFYCLSNLLVQTPKLKYLNVKLTNYGTGQSEIPLPTMMNLIHLKMNMLFVSYDDLSYLLKFMPRLQRIELSGKSMGENIDNGYQLKQLFGHLQKVQLKNVECLTSASSVNAILATFNDGMNEFWSNVTCSIEYDRAHLSAIGRYQN